MRSPWLECPSCCLVLEEQVVPTPSSTRVVFGLSGSGLGQRSSLDFSSGSGGPGAEGSPSKLGTGTGSRTGGVRTGAVTAFPLPSVGPGPLSSCDNLTCSGSDSSRAKNSFHVSKWLKSLFDSFVTREKETTSPFRSPREAVLGRSRVPSSPPCLRPLRGCKRLAPEASVSCRGRCRESWQR